MKRPLESLGWDNSFARLPESFYQRVTPTPLPNPRLVALNPGVADLLDLDASEGCRPGLVAAFNGDVPLPGSAPLAAIYAGHQFGVWVPQLGDGRAILFGEVVNSRHQRWDVQLKGGGLTRFSRMGDGRAVLRSTIREYLGGEAMHGLGIPTTRSLAIIGSDAPVYRERVESAALLVRVAPTHVRFGSFEVFAARGQDALVRQLTDYVIEQYFPNLLNLPERERYLAWLGTVIESTARLMAGWLSVGFAHGVMNTDNMSIAGITLDYGPFGWMDAFDRGFIPNHSDPAGRYAFDQQPRVGLWNCARLAEAILPLLGAAAPDAPEHQAVLARLEAYRGVFESEFDRLMRAKLGLSSAEADDTSLVADLLGVLHDSGTDYHRFFRALSRLVPGNSDDDSHRAVHALVGRSDPFADWLARYIARLSREVTGDAVRHEQMLRTNPKYVLRNWMAQEAITAAESGTFQLIDDLRGLLARPFDEHEAFERYAGPPPEWAQHLEVSCSS